MIEHIEFQVFCHPEPQGSSKGFPLRRKSGRMGVAITSDNKKLRPFRNVVAYAAAVAVLEVGGICPLADRSTPIHIELEFYFAKPPSTPRDRVFPVVKPDLDKLQRSALDALTGVLFTDDSQVVSVYARKYYGARERVVVKMRRASAVERPAYFSEAGLEPAEIPF